ncbi:mitochondrial glycine transporter B-like isoform X1 [Hydractinia symbiolongicarpus]|uniref:mitochondrial glycine transporter B-like isoform X1 n=1 Tax=Hydractinia symbiolongicarpus TaxID=13093 RepID=UPI0025504D8E|nr:mitochondrial glycine transporter B-like isoform X1 [Hydractinia symbiolongicarpus]
MGYSCLCCKFKEMLCNQNSESRIYPQKYNMTSVLKRTTEMQSSCIKSFLAGSLSGTLSCVLFQPLDLLKTRLQMASPISVLQKKSSQSNMISIVYNVIRTEKVPGLWRGVIPSLYRTVPGVGMYFSTLNFLKSFFSHETTFYENLALGFTSRAFVGAILLPVTVIKSRFESGQFNYTSVPQALRLIWRVEGLSGLYSGFSATIARDAPFSGLYLMFYSQGKKIASQGFIDEPGVKTHFLCGVVAGLLASVVSHPADVIKTQMQLYPSRYQNTIHCAKIIHAEHGTIGFLRGMVPRCLRRTLISALSWTVFEELSKNLNLKT